MSPEFPEFRPEFRPFDARENGYRNPDVIGGVQVPFAIAVEDFTTINGYRLRAQVGLLSWQKRTSPLGRRPFANYDSTNYPTIKNLPAAFCHRNNRI